MKCPICDTKYAKGVCSNSNCILSYKPEKEKFDWWSIYRAIRYFSIRNIYYKIKNRLFMRHDLIRTGMKKSQWCDKDQLILHGMMGLLVEYVEKEEAFAVIKLNFNKLEDGTPFGDAILELYTQWKVTYPKLLQEQSDALDAWSESNDISFKDNIFFKPKEGYTKEDCNRLSNRLHDLERQSCEMEQKMLHRLIDVRFGLWT